MQKELTTAYRQLNDEFQVVGDLQRSLLPKPMQEIGEYEIASHYSPSLQAGGDYYDFIKLSELHLGLLMVDVSGHGAAASMVISGAAASLFSQFSGEFSSTRNFAV